MFSWLLCFFPLGASLKENPGLVPLDPEVCVHALRGPRTWSWVTVHLGWASCHFGNQQSRQHAERRLRGTPFGWDPCLPPPHLPSGHWQVFRGTSGSQPSMLSRWCSRRGLHVCGREWLLFLISLLDSLEVWATEGEKRVLGPAAVLPQPSRPGSKRRLFPRPQPGGSVAAVNRTVPSSRHCCPVALNETLDFVTLSFSCVRV